MDAALVRWARSVKRRRGHPPLWLFTDPVRTPELLALTAALPKGLCGIVFRHDAAPARAALGMQLARLCRAAGIPLVVAGDARLAARMKAGVHLRAGHGQVRRPGLRTASAHGPAEALRARRRKASLVFLSPVYATRSHPGASVLGGHGFRALARLVRPAEALALGGITGGNIMRLGRICAGAGAIDAFLSKK